MSIASLGNINLDGITAENPGGYQGKPLVVTVSLHPGPESLLCTTCWKLSTECPLMINVVNIRFKIDTSICWPAIQLQHQIDNILRNVWAYV